MDSDLAGSKSTDSDHCESDEMTDASRRTPVGYSKEAYKWQHRFSKVRSYLGQLFRIFKRVV